MGWLAGKIEGYEYRIANIVPRECDATFSLQLSGKGGVPKLRVLVAR